MLAPFPPPPEELLEFPLDEDLPLPLLLPLDPFDPLDPLLLFDEGDFPFLLLFELFITLLRLFVAPTEPFEPPHVPPL